jgi:aerobic carbon-monoxide dehydrogenase small subunit
MSERFCEVSMRVNGEDVSERVEARKTLVDFLRDDLGLTGSHIGCEQGVCGACTVLLDAEVVRGCLVLAVQCDGAEVQTIEGLSDSGAIADLQDAFARRNALQCGFCTPGDVDRSAGLARQLWGAEPGGDPRAYFRQLLSLHRISGYS